MNGYRIKGLRINIDGSIELITEPKGVPIVIEPCTGYEAELLELASRGVVLRDKRVGYRLARECIKSGCFYRRRCKDCFFLGVCAITKDPNRLVKAGLLSCKEVIERLSEIAEAKIETHG